jgi:hypothetical protein
MEGHKLLPVIMSSYLFSVIIFENSQIKRYGPWILVKTPFIGALKDLQFLIWVFVEKDSNFKVIVDFL